MPDYDSRTASDLPAAKGYSTHIAIAGMVLALGCPPLGAVLGIVAAVQANRRGRSPVLGYVAIGVALASAVIGTVMVARG